MADTKARESIAQSVERQPSKWEEGRLSPTEYLTLCGTYTVSASDFLVFSLSAVHELDVHFFEAPRHQL